jgi:hypothetical protein
MLIYFISLISMLIDLFSYFHMRHLFRTYTFHMCYACEACRFRIVPFWTASECLRERAYDVTPDLDPVEISVA